LIFKPKRDAGGTTVTRNLASVMAAPSLTEMVMVAVPVWLLAGIIVKLRWLPDPLKTIPLFGIREGFEEVPLTVRLVAADSTSPMLKAMGALLVSRTSV
jgi:hypothetical protein